MGARFSCPVSPPRALASHSGRTWLEPGNHRWNPLSESLSNCRRMTALLILTSPAGAVVSLAGVPQPPTPAPIANAWIGLQNDFFGDAILNSNDFRTGGGHVGIDVDRVVLAVDASSLTNRGTHNGLPPSRSDELTYTVGYAVLNHEQTNQTLSWLVLVGGGGRTFGDLKTEHVQNEIHSTAGFPLVHLPYDPQKGTGALGYLYARGLYLPFQDLPAPLPASLGFQVEAGATSTSGRKDESIITGDIVGIGAQAVVWGGIQYQRDSGPAPTSTAAIVASHESGWWFQAGIGRTPGIYLVAAANPKTRAVDGSLGVTFQNASMPARSDRRAIDEMLELVGAGGAVGLQLRWHTPDLESKESTQMYHEVLVDYRFGEVPHYAWPGNRVDEDQFLVGYEPVLAGPFLGLPWLITEEFVYGSGGVRVERVEALRTSSLYPQTTGTSPVLQGGFGLRVGLDLWHNPRLFVNQIRFGIGWDGWLPLIEQKVTNGSERDKFMKPGNSIILSLGFAVIW